MDTIFSFIKRRIEYHRINPSCASNGCTCDGPINIDVQYDPENGYPTVVQERPLPEYRIKKYDPPTWCEDYNLPEGIELFVTSFKPL